MYKIFKSVIEKGNFDLNDMLDKIEAKWIEGKLSEAESLELNELARNHATSGGSVDILAKLSELDRKISELEAKLAGLGNSEPTEGEGESTEGEGESAETVKEFVEGKWYYTGNKIRFEGDIYVCIAPEGVVCVWSPTAHPAYWEKVEG